MYNFHLNQVIALLENMGRKPMHWFKYQLVTIKDKSFKHHIAIFRISKQEEDTSS